MHQLLVGQTLSGKTTLARQLAGIYKQAGFGVLVLDVLNDPRWPCDFRTDDADEFLDVVWSSRRCMVFIDEAGDSVGRYNEAMNKTATRGRHWGHVMHYCTQRITSLAPLVRDQCTGLFCFASGKKAGVLLAEEWNHPELEQCVGLLTGEHFHALKMGGIKRVDMFNKRGQANANRANSDRSGDHGRRNGAGVAQEGDIPEGSGSAEKEAGGGAAQKEA